ncbi:MAG: hypothetical protein M0Q14_12100 [Tissierellaceae bacterium]|nr:hypothetical protein [Tissierellaceae bacterium]
MKTTILVFLLLSVFFTLLVAQPARLSREEEDRRSKELTALSEQFKKETGFQGYLSHDTTLNKISSFDGGFPDLTFPPASEKEEVGLIFDEVLKRILPYLSVPREQLTRENVTGGDSLVRVQYTQRINGYDLEGGGRIRFFYNYKINELGMTNSLKKIHPSTLAAEPVITEDKIKEIFYDMIGYTEEDLLSRETKNTIFLLPKFTLMYCFDRNFIESPDISYPRTYRLAWKIDYVQRLVIIDAVSGEILVDDISLKRDYGNESGRGCL